MQVKSKVASAVIGTGLVAGLVVASGGVASAKTFITGKDIENQSITSVDIAAGGVGTSEIRNGSVGTADLSQATKDYIASKAGKDGKTGPKGDQGAKGAKGDTGAKGAKGDTGAKGDQGVQGVAGPAGLTGVGLQDAYYSIAKYNVGDTNAGAIATVACKETTDVAVSGGVQVTDFSKNTPVSSSFPGRMDWSTNSPKADRLDGWIVQFGGNAGETSDKAPEAVNIWALCVPGLSTQVETTYTQAPSVD